MNTGIYEKRLTSYAKDDILLEVSETLCQRQQVSKDLMGFMSASRGA